MVKGKWNWILACINAGLGALLFGLSISGIVEYCREMPSSNVAWYPITLWVLFLFSGIFLLIFVLVSFLLARRAQAWKKTTVASGIFLLCAWVFLPVSTLVGDFAYQASATYTRIEASQVQGVLDRCAEHADAVAKRYGDRVEIVDAPAKDWLESGAGHIRLYLRIAATEEAGISLWEEEIALILSYDRAWERLEVVVNCDVEESADGESWDWSALERPLEYFNGLADRPITLTEAVETATEEGYADWAWDGPAGQLRKFTPYRYIRSNTFWSTDENGRKDYRTFHFYGLAD